MEFVCKRCGHEAKTKGNLLQHLRKKKTCRAILEDVNIDTYINELIYKEYNEITYQCEHCNKKFNTYQSRWRHMKICKKIPSSNNITNTVDNNTNSTVDNNTKQNINIDTNENTNLYVVIQELRNEIGELKKIQQQLNTYNITTNNTFNNTININIKDLGRENISYLSTEFLSRCFVNKDIFRLLENIHCDKEHPENHNIRIKSQKRNQIETRENDKWMIKDEDEALTTCIQNGYRILSRHGYQYKKEIIEDELDDDEEEYYNIKEWLDKLYEDTKVQKPIKRKILLLLLSNHALLLGKDIVNT